MIPELPHSAKVYVQHIRHRINTTRFGPLEAVVANEYNQPKTGVPVRGPVRKGVDMLRTFG
jgi:hypothetical protein